MHREMGQPSAVEALLPPTLGQNQRLARIAAAVDWAPIGQLVSTIYAAPVGRPSYPPLLLVKALLLAQWYDLSDPSVGRSVERPALLPPLCGAGTARRHPGPLHDQSVSSGVGPAGVERGPLCGGDGPTGAAGAWC